MIFRNHEKPNPRPRQYMSAHSLPRVQDVPIQPWILQGVDGVFTIHQRTSRSDGAPIWTQITSIPSGSRVPVMFRAIGSILGKYLTVDNATAAQHCPLMARICVLVDTTKVLPLVAIFVIGSNMHTLCWGCLDSFYVKRKWYKSRPYKWWFSFFYQMCLLEIIIGPQWWRRGNP